MCALGEYRLASAGDDGTVRVWSASSGEQLLELSGHGGWVRSVCALDEDRLASAGADGTVVVWGGARCLRRTGALVSGASFVIRSAGELPLTLARPPSSPWFGSEDPDLFRLAGFVCTDATAADDPDAPTFRVSPAAYPDARGKLWDWDPDTPHLFHFAWPTDARARQRLQSMLLGPAAKYFDAARSTTLPPTTRADARRLLTRAARGRSSRCSRSGCAATTLRRSDSAPHAQRARAP